tara:strand:- start:15 stop:401 length:387 start_codon:yes stop_codon:yes gene_type:complete
MTRVNAGIRPEELPNKLLIAEHREITRIPNAIKSGRAKIVNIPSTFRLNTGHVKFFYTRLLYIKKRYYALYDECKSRQFDVTAKHSAFDGLSQQLMNDYEASEQDRQLIIERIEQRGFKLLHMDTLTT